MREEEERYKTPDPSTVDPTSVSFNCLPARLSQCAELQRHRCSSNCLLHKWTKLECKKRGFDPDTQKVSDLRPDQIPALFTCKKRFPKIVPDGFAPLRAHVVMKFTKIVEYHPPRDDAMINGCHPMIAHMWNANTDLQILHGQGKRLMENCTLVTRQGTHSR